LLKNISIEKLSIDALSVAIFHCRAAMPVKCTLCTDALSVAILYHYRTAMPVKCTLCISNFNFLKP